MFSWDVIDYTEFRVAPKHELIGNMISRVLASGQPKVRDGPHQRVNQGSRSEPWVCHEGSSHRAKARRDRRGREGSESNDPRIKASPSLVKRGSASPRPGLRT